MNLITETLANKGFISRRSLVKLNGQVIKKEFGKGILITQQLLLEDATAALHSEVNPSVQRMSLTAQAETSSSPTEYDVMMHAFLNRDQSAATTSNTDAVQRQRHYLVRHKTPKYF